MESWLLKVLSSDMKSKAKSKDQLTRNPQNIAEK